METTLICHGCHTVATVNRVTASLRCTCGSADLDLFEGHGPTFLEAMGAAHGPGTGWGKTMPDPLDGWANYAGPMPGQNPWGHPAIPQRCGNCRGSGWSLRERCRACFGTGVHTPPTAVSPAPLVAPHPGQTRIPFVGGRPTKDGRESVQDVLKATVPGFGERGQMQPPKPNEDPYRNEEGRYPGADAHSPHMQRWKPGPYSDNDLRNAKPYPMHGAGCPSCGHSPTHLVKDHNEDAWWTCPNCGPLANIDKHPDIDPYGDHGEDFAAQPGFKATGKRAKGRGAGRLLPMVHAVARTNPGLHQREVVGLVRKTLMRYGG